MPVEENKVLLRRYIEEVLSQGNIDAVNKFLLPTVSTTPHHLKLHLELAG